MYFTMPLPYLDRTPQSAGGRRRIAIIGGGFGGLACARALANCDACVTVIDSKNHHLFQPLLYQVATAALSPADIAIPLRAVLGKAPNIGVIMATASGVDTVRRHVLLADGGYVPFDQLVVATGSVYNYFAHPEWAAFAPAPKSIADARAIRARLLKAFEDAESCADPERRAALMTVVVIGGGPTGVEMAGTIAELARSTLRGDFRSIDPAKARVILVEAGPKLLAQFPEELGVYAASALEKLGVEVMVGAEVAHIDSRGVRFAGKSVDAANVIWGAGIRAAAGAQWLSEKPASAGKIPVRANMAVMGHDGIFAIGDVASFLMDGQTLPALAQVAQQQGNHLGRQLRGSGAPSSFHYRSKGDTAVIGRNAAVFVYGRFRLKGKLAWLLWSIVHVYLLVGFQQRTLVMTQWIWRYFTSERGARLID